VVACAGSLVARFRRARGVERQQLRWVALAALIVVAAGVVLAGLALAATEVVTWAITAWLTGLPLAIGAAVLRYRLYDLDRIVSRTVVVAAATLAVAVVFQPARRRIQQAVDRRFNRRRYDAARTVEAFAARLREQVDLDALTAELLAVLDQTMQPTQASLWLRPSQADARSTGI
jgi:hypothetical protein